MTQKNNLTRQPNLRVSFGRSMLIGAAVGLILISLFVFNVSDPKPEWGKFWRIRPLLITPLAGAMGGLFYGFMNYLSLKSGFNKALAIIIGLIVFIVALWLGIVLGLDGTLWN